MHLLEDTIMPLIEDTIMSLLEDLIMPLLEDPISAWKVARYIHLTVLLSS